MKREVAVLVTTILLLWVPATAEERTDPLLPDVCNQSEEAPVVPTPVFCQIVDEIQPFGETPLNAPSVDRIDVQNTSGLLTLVRSLAKFVSVLVRPLG